MMIDNDDGGGWDEIRMTCQNCASSCSMGVEEEEEEEEEGVVPTLYTRPDYARAIKRGAVEEGGKILVCL